MTKPAVIFDLDGTLIDSAPDIHAGVLQVLKTEGLPEIAFAQTRSFIGRGVPALIAQVREALGLGEDAAQAQRMAAQFTELYEEAFAHTVLYPHVRATLETLAAGGHALAICTNKPELPTYSVLEHFGLRDMFQGFAFGDGPYPRKPDPAPVRHVFSNWAMAQRSMSGTARQMQQPRRLLACPFCCSPKGIERRQLMRSRMTQHFGIGPRCPGCCPGS